MASKAHPSASRQAAVMAAGHGLRRAASGLERLVTKHGLTTTDLAALHLLGHAGSASAGQLAAVTGLSSGAVTAMLDRLESAGYVERRRSAEDRRVVHAVLRPGAHLRMAAAMMAAHRGADAMFRGWPTGDVVRFLAMLDRIEVPAGR